MKVVTSVILTASEPVKTDGDISIELNAILKAVCYINQVDIFDVKGKRRFRELVTARREYSYLACKLTQLSVINFYSNSLATIGAEINIDHATVLYHKKKIKEWLNIPGYNLKEKFELIENQLKI
jgi:chromosomal replication initiation ATPase DnaA